MLNSATENQSRVARYLLHLFSSGCKRVLLVQPPQLPVEDFRIDVALSRRYFCFPPYGPGLIAAATKAQGYEADIIDLNLAFLTHIFEVQKSNQINLHLWSDLLIKKIGSFQADLVAVSCMFTMAHLSMCRVAEAVKTQFPQLPVVGGGVHISNDTEAILRSCASIDFAMKWESDVSFANLLKFLNGTAGAESLSQIAILLESSYVELGRNELPKKEALFLRPDYGSLDVNIFNRYGRLGAYEFLHGNKPASTVLSNRGCRARCTFCSVRQFNGVGVRSREITAVIDEIAHLSEVHGIQHFMWLDDDLLYDARRAQEMFEQLASRRLGITWDASNGIIAAAITHELMQAMVASGCIGFHLGLESGDKEILRAVKKPGTLETYLRAGEILKSYPEVFVKGFLIIGFPNETIAQLQNTVTMALTMELGWYAISILTPLPSTEIYVTMKEMGLLEDNLKTSRNVSFSNTDAKQRAREEREIVKASEFLDLFSLHNPTDVPTREELNDLWFLMDYQINYERILSLSNVKRIQSIALMLEEVCDRITKDNALGNLFLAVAKSKLGKTNEAIRRALLSEEFLTRSAYWQKRFHALNLYPLLEAMKDPGKSAHITQIKRPLLSQTQLAQEKKRSVG